ncbi:glycerophosphodiester phosphodiesterase [Mangrovicella endophytica]|uniref:glycerophosphodiester phosphodiesterase n=1 Tax=Mangrovicella endophytica TaxID=2066697 RepID=UPI000C9E1B5A|nr:glycerophosphodiester phosphodiesterase [Mangrovicella endophytica]
MVQNTPPSIIAHRGFSARCRENSPAAWLAATEAGADLVEVDIRMTRDGTLVCCHDGDLMRLAERPEAIAAMDAQELAAIVVDGAAAAPPLSLLFSVLPETQAILFDVKDERPQVLDLLVTAAQASGRADVTYGLHDIASVRHVRTRTDARILGLLRDADDAEPFFAAGGDILRLWEVDATAERLGTLRRRQRPVWATVGHHGTDRRVGDFDPLSLRRMAAHGVSGFLVNDPVAARDTLSNVPSDSAA